MHPETDGPLRAMPITDKAEAEAYVIAYREWLRVNNPYGHVLPVNSKPATIRSPDLCAKARIAHEMAEACYWQMPFELARKRFWGLPRAKWEAERKKRGLHCEDETHE